MEMRKQAEAVMGRITIFLVAGGLHDLVAGFCLLVDCEALLSEILVASC